MANMYFLILMIMELYPPISDCPNSKVPALLLPLSFVVGLSMVKDIWEDVKRHRSDNEENNRRVLVGVEGQRFADRKWDRIKVG